MSQDDARGGVEGNGDREGCGEEEGKEVAFVLDGDAGAYPRALRKEKNTLSSRIRRFEVEVEPT